MPAVNMAEWLMAVEAHPETLDTDLAVATAIANDGVIGHNPRRLDGIDPRSVDDSVEELIALGFLEPVLVTDHPEGEEHVLELRYP